MNTNKPSYDPKKDKIKTYAAITALIIGILILIPFVIFTNRYNEEQMALEDNVVSSSILVQGTSSYPAAIDGKRVTIEGVDCIVVINPSRQGIAVSCDWPRKD